MARNTSGPWRATAPGGHGAGIGFEKFGAFRWDLAVIEKVEPQSPAAAVGIAKGDIVTAANNVAIKNSSQFRNLVGLLPVGREIDLRLKRGSDLVSAKVRVEAAATQRSTQRARRD
jgi:S1-C subfamily serine protease